MRPSIFYVKASMERHGFWYAVWQYGAKNLWTIFVATRMIKRDAFKSDWIVQAAA